MHCNSYEREGSKEEKYERSNPSETSRLVKEEVGGGVLGMKAEIPLQPVQKVMVKQVVLLEPMEMHSRADPPCSSWRFHDRGSGSALKKTAACGASLGAGSWQKLQPVERSLHKSWFCGRSLQVMGDPWWNGLLLKPCTFWGQPHWSSL